MKPIYPNTMKLLTSIALLMLTFSPAQAESSQQATLAKICENVQQHFYDADLNGLNWSALCDKASSKLPVAGNQFSSIANSLLGQLNTSHTAYYAPDDLHHALLLDVYRGNPALKAMINKQYGERPFWESSGFFTVQINGKHFVDQILAGSPAKKAGLLRGDEIISLDNQPFHPVLSFRGKDKKTVKITYRRHQEGSPQTIEVAVQKVYPLEMLDDAARQNIRIEKIKGKRIGYIRFWSLAGVEPAKLFRKALGFGGKLANSDALVVDIRVQVGGGMLPMDVIAPITLPIRIKTRTGYQPEFEEGLKDRFVLIVDHHTRSAAELLANLVSVKKLGTLVGERTQGAVTGGRLFPLPDGGIEYLAVVGIEQAGVMLEGHGVTPDYPVETNLPYSAGDDPILKKAFDIALEKTGKK